MAKNLVRRIYNRFQTSWTAPAGVNQLTITVLDKFDQLISAGTTSSLLKKTGAIFTCGLGTSGQLGDNTIVSKSTLTPVVGGHSFTALSSSSGGSTLIALKADGSAWAWGIGTLGQLGDSTLLNKSSPVAVAGGHSFISVSLGTSSTTAGLKSNGSMWTWGTSINGQLGDNTIVAKSSPVPVVGGHSFIQMNVGIGTSVALKADGSAWAWGQNSSGDIGDGTVILKSSPVAVIGGHSFINISAGNGDTHALKEDGSIWSWGLNNFGVLGDNTMVNKSSPVAVGGGHSFISFSSGNASILALKSDGSVWAWGLGSSGQLGNNSTLPKSSPVAVVGGHSFIAISEGSTMGYALKSDGSVWSWGQNSAGQLGDNSIVPKSSPVLIIGTNLFEAGIVYSNKRTFNVTPGTTYNLNGFLTQIGAQVMASNAGNNVYIVLEYYA